MTYGYSNTILQTYEENDALKVLIIVLLGKNIGLEALSERGQLPGANALKKGQKSS